MCPEKPRAAARRPGDATLSQTVEGRIRASKSSAACVTTRRPPRKHGQSTPEDADARQALGRCYCLARHDWDHGLPLLAQGKATALSAAAGRVVAQPGDSAAKLALADAWWDEAEGEKQSEPLANLYREAACHWYEEASTGLSDKDFRKVEQRLMPLEASGSRSGLFAVPTARIGRLRRAGAKEGRWKSIDRGRLRDHAGW